MKEEHEKIIRRFFAFRATGATVAPDVKPCIGSVFKFFFAPLQHYIMFHETYRYRQRNKMSCTPFCYWIQFSDVGDL